MEAMGSEVSCYPPSGRVAADRQMGCNRSGCSGSKTVLADMCLGMTHER